MGREIIRFFRFFSDVDTGLSANKLKEMAAISTERIYDTEDLGPVATIKSSLAVIQQMAANLAQKMAECENELAIAGQQPVAQTGSTDNESITPILIRAQAAIKESEETKILARKLETRDSDIRECRIALREKQEELSEMVLRRDLAEKRLTHQQREHELDVDKLKRKLEEAQNQLKRKVRIFTFFIFSGKMIWKFSDAPQGPEQKEILWNPSFLIIRNVPQEKEFEETMDHLQTDIESLELERGQLKEKLKTFGKKTSMTPTGPGSTLPSTDGSTSIPSNGSSSDFSHSSFENRLLNQEISALKEALNSENRQKSKLLANDLRNKLNSLQPLPDLSYRKRADAKLDELQKERGKLLEVKIFLFLQLLKKPKILNFN